MVAWPFKYLLQLLLILYHMNLLSSQSVHDHATAPASWINNSRSIINGTWSESFRAIILLKEISESSYDISFFACGFFLHPGNDTFFFFAIGIVHLLIYSHNDTSVDVDLVWFTNRNKPVGEGATLNLLSSDGDLILREADGTQVWSTNTFNTSMAGIKLMETGNLVLYDKFNRTIWQSFDHPVDTLLPGKKLMAGQKLVARVSTDDWTEGDYYLTVTSHGLFAFYQSNMPQMYFKFLVQGTGESTDTSYVKFINGTLALYISSTEPSEPDAVLLKPSRMQYMKFDPDGHFRVYSGINGDIAEPVDLFANFLSACDYPNASGNFGLCVNGLCSCPGGFVRADVSTDQNDNGCMEISQTTCTDPHSYGFLQLADVYYFNYVDNDAAVLKGTNVESCKEACLKNCSCKAALFWYFNYVSHGNCFLPSPVFSLISDGKERNVYQSSAFIKFRTIGQT
ncbi:unnamed protein product [Ilex paraguariensis]|uniref:Uncharacterized protein n=1 Tax=Ilex paraguariensis TaxID=185542 RepID=A0ABC8RU32_9AQUA